jgi:hypothetical protein
MGRLANVFRVLNLMTGSATHSLKGGCFHPGVLCGIALGRERLFT